MTDEESKERAIRVWFRFLRLESRIRSAVADRLRAIGLSVPQCDVLTTRSEAEGISQQELAKRAIALQHQLIGATLGKLAPEKLAAFETLLVATRDLVRADRDREAAATI